MQTPCDPRAPAALQAMGSCLLSVDTRDVGAEEEKAAVLQYAAEGPSHLSLPLLPFAHCLLSIDAYSKCATPITYSATPAQSFLLSALGTKSYTTQAGWQIGGPAGASILSSLDAAMTTVTVFDWETTTTTVASAPPSPSSAAPNVTVAGPRISGNASLATLAETTSKGGKGVDGWRAFGVGVLALAVALFLFLLPL